MSVPYTPEELSVFDLDRYTSQNVPLADAVSWLQSNDASASNLQDFSDTYDTGTIYLDDLWDAYAAQSVGATPSSHEVSTRRLQDSGLTLDRYTKNTDVELSENERNIMELVNQLVTGQYGNYKQLLSGQPDFGQLYSGVIEPARRELQENMLPQIADIYGASPHGAGYNTGARKEAQADALRGFADSTASMRYNATEQAKQTGLQAAGMLPAFEGIQQIERLNEIANVEREIGVHYRNQGLSVEEFNADMAFTNQQIQQGQFGETMGLEQEKLDLQREMFEYQVQVQQQAQEDAENSGMFGSIGSLLGAGIGLATGTGPAGMMLGSSLGSGIGLLAGGSPGAGYQTIAGGMGNYSPQQQQNSMMQQIMGMIGNTGGTQNASQTPLYQMGGQNMSPVGGYNYYQSLYNQGR